MTSTNLFSLINKSYTNYGYYSTAKIMKMNGYKQFMHRIVKNEVLFLFKMKEGLNQMNNKAKVMKYFKIYAATVASMTLCLLFKANAFADGDPIAVISNLSDFIFGLIRAVGVILLGWGIVQVGLSLQSHDPSQRSNGFLTLAGGIVITFAREILELITGGSI